MSIPPDGTVGVLTLRMPEMMQKHHARRRRLEQAPWPALDLVDGTLFARIDTARK
jgi:hypothetical protein